MNATKKLTGLICAASGIALLSGGSPVYGQVAAEDAQPPSGTPIVVTGSRLREESVQNVPVAVSVLDSEAIDDLHASDIQALTSNVPSLIVSNNPTGNQVPIISLRGFSVVGTDLSIEPGISIYVDGIYQPTIVGGLSDLFDVERVEVLRGPQSTLLGKNSTAGAILVRRSRPGNDLEGRARVEYGTDNLFQAQALVNFPIADGILAGKVYGMYRSVDNYAENLFPGGRDLGGNETTTLRGALMFTPSDNVDWYVSADYTHRNNSMAAGRNEAPNSFLPCVRYGFCFNQSEGSHQLNLDFSDHATHDDYSATSELNVRLGGAQITSLTGYRNLEMLNNSDVDGTPFPLLHAFDQRTTVEAFSQEVRLGSVEGEGLDLGGRLAWLLAAYYNDSSSYLYEPRILFGGAPTIGAQGSDRTSYAIFGHLDFDLTDALTVSLGARKSWDEVTHSYMIRAPGLVAPDPLPFTQSRQDSNFSFEAGMQYQIDPTKMVYFRYSEGYRGGGFLGFPGSVEQAEGGYGPETARSYEIGLRSEFLDGGLLFNLTLYNAEYSDLQRSETKPSPTGFIIITDNIASARTRGIELEAIARPVDGLNIQAVMSYLDANYSDYISGGVDLSATNFSYAPEWTVSLTPSYEFDLGSGRGLFDTARIQGHWEYRSTYLAGAQDVPAQIQPGYSTFDAQVSLTGGSRSRYTLTAYVQNLTNERYQVYGVYVPPLLFQVFDERGRRFGVSAQIQF